jgi:hypothetical protein
MILDENLNLSQVDIAFIGANFDENALENNDDKRLCRYEFLEVIGRMAVVKYYNCDKRSSVAESCQAMIEDYILPNTCEVMPWQEFRDNQLWTLEVDDVFKAN